MKLKDLIEIIAEVQIVQVFAGGGSDLTAEAGTLAACLKDEIVDGRVHDVEASEDTLKVWVACDA